MRNLRRNIILRRRRRQGLGGFDPRTIPGLNLWLDANDSSTLWQDAAGTTPAAANNDVIGKWDDKSGNGYHVVQATAGNKPYLAAASINGRNSVHFEVANADRLVKTSYAGTFTRLYIFAVVTFASNSANYSGVVCAVDASGQDYTDTNGFALFRNSTTYQIHFSHQQATGPTEFRYNDVTALLTQNVAAQVTIYGGNTAGAQRINATQIATDTYTAINIQPTTLVLGGRAQNGGYWLDSHDGKIAELLIYAPTADFSIGTITTIEAYLKAKWGTP